MNSELIAVLDYMEQERGIGRELLIETVEDAVLKASKKALGENNDIRIEVDRKILSDLAIREPDAFKALVDQAQAALAKTT